MAKARGPLKSSSASGTIADSLYFSSWKGENRVSKHFKPRNPRTTAQQLQRSYLTHALLSWHTLTAQQKQQYEQEAISKGLRMSGYNYYISQYIQGLVVPPPPVGPILDGLISWWKFDENTDIYAYDSHGNNDITLYGPSWVTGKINYAVHFDGSDDYGRVANEHNFDFDYDDPISVEFWIYNQQTDSGKSYDIISKWRNASPNDGWAIILSAFDAGELNVVFININDIGVIGKRLRTHADDDFIALAGEWHHVVVTYDGSGQDTGVKFYIDASLRTRKSQTGFGSNTYSSLNDLKVIIGARRTGATDIGGLRWMYGNLDELRIYNKVLSLSEIQHNYSL